MNRLLNIVGENKGWAVPNRAKNLRPYLSKYFEVTDYFKWDLPNDFNDYDLIHMHEPICNKKISQITTLWGFEIGSERVLPKVLKSGLCQKANFVIVKNRVLYEKVWKQNECCYLIPNGVDIDLFKPSPIRVGWVGNDVSSKEYREYKGTDLIDQACQELDREMQGLFEITFIKDPSHYPIIYSQEDIAEFYKSLDVFVLASEAEGSSNVVLEALAMGLPVVTTKVGNWRMLGQLGIVIPVERTVHAIKKGIQIAIQDKIKRRKAMQQHYGWENFAKQYLAIYKRIGVRL